MTNEELNRYIHERVLGRTPVQVHCRDCHWCSIDNPSVCERCGGSRIWDSKAPDYTTSLDAVREAEIKTVERFGEWEYTEALGEALEAVQMKGVGVVWECLEYALADALTRCKAIREVWGDE